MKFEEIGKLLDDLKIEEKIKQASALLDKVAFPETKVRAKQTDELEFASCSPKVNYKCVQLKKENAVLIKNYLLNEKNYWNIEITERGVDTEYGIIKWGWWIVLEPNSAVVYYDEEEFDNDFYMVN